MKLKVSPAFSGVLKAAFSASTFGPLGNGERFVYVKALLTECFVYAASLQEGVLVKFDASEFVEIEAEGEAFFPKRLADFLVSFGKELPEDAVISSEDSRETRGEIPVEVDVEKIVVYLNGAATLCLNQPTLNADALRQPTACDGEYCEIDGGDLTPALERAVKYASDPAIEKTPALTGVLFKASGSELRVVACDTKRLFTTTWDFETPVPETFERVVFSKTLAKILRLLRGDVVEIAAGPDSLFFRSGVVEARVQTIDGRYPNLLPILEKKGERDATLDVEETLAASRRVDVVNESKQTGELRYAFRTGEVVVSSPSTSYGEAEIGTTCRYSKPPTTVRFTNAYILDYLSSCVDEYVRVYFNENTPITFEDSLGTTIIMPLA